MEYGNYYTEETLRSLNAAYDTLYGITSRETEKVNGIIRRMEKAGRFPPVPQEGDLLEYFPQNGDYWARRFIRPCSPYLAFIRKTSQASRRPAPRPRGMHTPWLTPAR